jgi:hypothetical protein
MDRFTNPNWKRMSAPNHVMFLGPLGTKPRNKAREAGTGERGAGRLKAIIVTLILASAIYVGIKVIPVLFAEYEFQDGMQTIARFASANGQPVDKIHDAVVAEAAKDELPVTADNIKVVDKGGNVSIDVDYSVTVDLKVYQWTLNFHPSVSNASLL